MMSISSDASFIMLSKQNQCDIGSPRSKVKAQIGDNLNGSFVLSVCVFCILDVNFLLRVVIIF